MKGNHDFFAEQSANSEIKMQIVLTAFKLWLKDVKTKQNLTYIDLFAGAGIYDDGTLYVSCRKSVRHEHWRKGLMLF